MAEFGRLEPVDLRTAWRHEALNFTPWLAENLDRLSQAVGIEMSLEDTEVQIDRFSRRTSSPGMPRTTAWCSLRTSWRGPTIRT